MTQQNPNHVENKSKFKGSRTPIISSLFGAVVGYLFLHPYTMVIYTLAHIHQREKFFSGWHWRELFNSSMGAFNPVMLPMTIAFLFMGGLIGLLVGVLVKRKKRLIAAEHENENKKIALQTLNELMVTLSHYLLNANMIIGGMVRHSKKKELENDTLASLNTIGEHAARIDAVINALKKVTELKTTRYTSNGHSLLLDISQELEQLLNATTSK